MAFHFVSASSDDANQQGTTVRLTETTLNIRTGGSGTNDADWAGFRFTGVTIAPGTLVVASKLQLYCTKGDDPNLRIYAEAVDDATTFTTGASNISNRTRTTASVLWDVNNTGSGLYVDSPDISAVLQEIVDRPGWVSGNDINIILQALSATEAFTIEAFDNAATNNPALGILSVTARPAAKQVTFTHNQSTATGGTSGTATPAAKQISFTHNAPTVSVGNTATPAAKQVTFTHNQSTALTGTVATPAAKQVTFTHNTPAVTSSAAVTPAAKQVTFTHNTSNAVGQTPANATPASKQITFTFTVPSVSAEFVIEVPTPGFGVDWLKGTCDGLGSTQTVACRGRVGVTRTVPTGCTRPNLV